MAAPCALFASCTAFNPQEIVKQILDVHELPEGQHLLESIHFYDWHIDTKYYTADVHLCTTDVRTIGDHNFAQSVQAFIVYFDSQEVSSFEKVKSWIPYLSHIRPAVQILVCETSRQSDPVTRLTAQQWCIEHGFELVELQPEENSDDEDCDFVESNGVKRIIQALHAHTWPNLRLKNRSPVCSPYFRNLMQEEATLKASAAAATGQDERSDAGKTTEVTDILNPNKGTLPLDDVCQAESQNSGQHDLEENRTLQPPNEGKKECSSTIQCSQDTGVAEAKMDDERNTTPVSNKTSIDELVPDDNELAMLAALGNEDSGGESFEVLFSRLRLMKEKAANMPPEERKTYAEKIAVTFWRAIGGDEDEIEGLFDDVDMEGT